jgi:hypothetical protein
MGDIIITAQQILNSFAKVIQLALFVCFFSVFPVFGQEKSADEQKAQNSQSEADSTAFDFFSITHILQNIRQGGTSLWQPDWPVDVPPDAFAVPQARLITLKTESDDLQLAFDKNGKAISFPFFWEGVLCPVSISYNGAESVQKITIHLENKNEEKSETETEAENKNESKIAIKPETGTEGENNNNIEIEFLEYDTNASPVLAQVNNSGEWFFVTFNTDAETEIIETWMDEEGKALAVFVTQKSSSMYYNRIVLSKTESSGVSSEEEIFYDSMGNISGIVNETGEYYALYSGRGAQYWRRMVLSQAIEDYVLQWNSAGNLAELSGQEAHLRYEYTFDTHGNWIQRREIKMVNEFGVLIPQSITVVDREIEYR